MKYLKSIFKTVKHESPMLCFITMVLFTGAVLSIPAMLIDDREIMGINIWLKPFKFFISTAIYTLTVGYIITFYPFSNLKSHIIRNLVSWTMLFELVIITIQAIRGEQSHFNTTTTLNGILFGLMGIFIGINVIVMAFMAFETVRCKLKLSKVIQYSLLLGWLVIIFGSWIGGQMIEQMSHNVGIQDGGEGLPLLNWSTIGGDLRVAHFFGLHSIQIIPIFAFFIIKKVKRSFKIQILLVSIFSLLFASFVFYTYYQAYQGLPFTA